MDKAAFKDLSLPIVTQRLLIRDFVLADIPAVIDIVKNPQFMGYRQFRPAHIKDDVTTYIQKAIDAQTPAPEQRRELFRLAICLQDGHVIGCCVFAGWHKLSDDQDQIGYFIHPAHQGHGYAAEAARGLLTAYWVQYPDRPVYASAHPSNKPSQKVLEKLDFSPCGSKSIEVDGRLEPRLIYSAKAPNSGMDL